MKRYRTAIFYERDSIVALARRSPFTAGFSNIMFSGRAHFEKGWIGVCVDESEKDVEKMYAGFVCLRHKVREPVTVIYDVGVAPEYQRLGIGRKLVFWAMKSGPHDMIKLNVDDTNDAAKRFYRRLGFVKVGVGAWSAGSTRERTYTTYSVTRDALESSQ